MNWFFVDDTFGKEANLTIPSGFTEIRKRHWLNSRYALLLALREELSLSQEKVSADDLIIENHHSLKSYPELLCSLAHTRGGACAVVTPKSSQCQGIGIDVEREDRGINEGVAEKFINPTDQYPSLQKAWCLKEAAFKASTYFWDRKKTFILKDIALGPDLSFSVRLENQILKGTGDFFIKDGYLICTATVHTIEPI